MSEVLSPEVVAKLPPEEAAEYLGTLTEEERAAYQVLVDADQADKAPKKGKARKSLPTPQGRDYNDDYVYPLAAVNAHFADPEGGHAHRDATGHWQVGPAE